MTHYKYNIKCKVSDNEVKLSTISYQVFFFNRYLGLRELIPKTIKSQKY